jgi:hypothetical protein
MSGSSKLSFGTVSTSLLVTSAVISYPRTESLVPVASLSVAGSLSEDLVQLQEHLEDKEPCYIMARLDEPPSEWLAISYVPDSAKVRDKVSITADIGFVGCA